MRRRAMLLITALALALLVAASSVTLADDITCPNGIGNLCTGTSRADTMTGTSQRDDMRSLGGQDTLRARGGPDSLEGGAGDDSLSGGDGDDTYSFGADWGADRIPAGGEDAGMGTDTLDFSSPFSSPLLRVREPLDVDLVSSAQRDEVYSVFSGAGMLNFPATVEIENVKGGQARDVVRGNNVANHLSGESGNDSLYGRGGDDRLIGDLGADALVGDLGADTLVGGVGNDYLEGGSGADTVYGDNPDLPVETGDDTIDVRDGQSEDTVDCGPGTDTVYYDVPTATSPGDTVTNCERENP